jgi:TetR/AcrR family transcriptional regulator, transcriptional repressor for nem operon
VSGSQVYHYFEDKQALVRAVIDHQAEAVLGTQGTHLDHLDTIPGLRAWRDLLVEHQRSLECRGGCPLGTVPRSCLRQLPQQIRRVPCTEANTTEARPTTATPV